MKLKMTVPTLNGVKRYCICSNTSENMVDYKHSCIAKQRPSSLMSSTKLWRPSLYPHASYAIERPYNNHLQRDKTHLLLCVQYRVITFLYCTILWRYHIVATWSKYFHELEYHMLCTKCICSGCTNVMWNCLMIFWNKLYTVKPLLRDPPKSGQPLYSGRLTCPRLILPLN